MTDEHSNTDDASPVETSGPATHAVAPAPTAAVAPANPPSTTRKWLVGAVLVTAGLVAGSGATYALTASASPGQGQFSNSQGGPGGGYGRVGGSGMGGSGMGGPPGSNGTDQNGATQGNGSTAPSGNASTQTQTG